MTIGLEDFVGEEVTAAFFKGRGFTRDSDDLSLFIEEGAVSVVVLHELPTEVPTEVGISFRTGSITSTILEAVRLTVGGFKSFISLYHFL